MSVFPTLCMRWPEYWSFSLSIIPSKEHPGLISFRMDWLDLLAVQGALKSLLGPLMDTKSRDTHIPYIQWRITMNIVGLLYLWVFSICGYWGVTAHTEAHTVPQHSPPCWDSSYSPFQRKKSGTKTHSQLHGCGTWWLGLDSLITHQL